VTAVGGTAVGTSRPPAAGNRDAPGSTRPQSASVPGTCTWAGGPSEGERALVQRLSRGSQATSERYTEEALALTDWSGAPFPDEAVEGRGGAPLSGGQLRGDRSTQPGQGRLLAAVKWTSQTPPSREAPGAFRGCPIHEDNADDQLDPSISRQPAHRPRAAVPPTLLRFGPTPPGQPSRPSPPLLHHCLLHRR
jgi:hypothetical protein